MLIHTWVHFKKKPTKISPQFTERSPEGDTSGEFQVLNNELRSQAGTYRVEREGSLRNECSKKLNILNIPTTLKKREKKTKEMISPCTAFLPPSLSFVCAK